jgi:hypothetical protein
VNSVIVNGYLLVGVFVTARFEGEQDVSSRRVWRVLWALPVVIYEIAADFQRLRAANPQPGAVIVVDCVVLDIVVDVQIATKVNPVATTCLVNAVPRDVGALGSTLYSYSVI